MYNNVLMKTFWEIASNIQCIEVSHKIDMLFVQLRNTTFESYVSMVAMKNDEFLFAIISVYVRTYIIIKPINVSLNVFES